MDAQTKRDCLPLRHVEARRWEQNGDLVHATRPLHHLVAAPEFVEAVEGTER
jgi:hypothetical protein